jgi:c-di-GMP-related signal transduction protein
MQDDLPTAPLERLFLGRQPILDGRETLIGYELLFRDSPVNSAPAVQPGVATADVVCKAFTELGLASALGGHKAFIIADAEFLRHQDIEVLPSDGVVFELDMELAADVEIAERCLELGRLGYSFCLTNPAKTGLQVLPLFSQSMFLKLNIKALDNARLQELVDQSAEHKLIPIASHVETQDDYRRAVALGFHFFQGYFFAQPTLVEGRKVNPATQALIHVISLLNRDAELAQVEQAFKGDAALTLKLLRLTNSAGIGLRVRISSVRQAINVIGRRHIQRWLQLLLFSQDGARDIGSNPLMQLAALKGNFMERLALRCFPQQAGLSDQAFLAGLMSLMPAVLGMPMEDILEQLAIAQPLRRALLMRGGELGILLDLTDCYDNDDPLGVEAVLAMIGHRIGREVLNQCLVESIAWVESLAIEAS